MTDYTGSDTFHNVITGPSTADTITASSVNDPGVMHQDNDVWLKNRLVGCWHVMETIKLEEALTFAAVLDLLGIGGGGDAWIDTATDIPDAEVDLANDLVSGDVLQVFALAHVRSQNTTVPDNRLNLTITINNSPIALATVSSEADSVQAVSLDAMVKWATTTLTTPTIKLRAYMQTSATVSNTVGMVYSPWTLHIVHVRPVAAP